MKNDRQASLSPNAPWLDIARKEIGQKEVVGHHDNPRILAYHATTTLKATDDETPWCSSFVNWCLKQAGIKGTDSAVAKSWVHWGMPSGPFPGAVTVICSSKATDRSFSTSGPHVGFLIKETATHFKLLGGNQSNTVKEYTYRKSSKCTINLRVDEGGWTYVSQRSVAPTVTFLLS